MKQTQEEKDAVMEELDEIIRRCNILGCKMIVVVPSMDLDVHATVAEIREDAVAVLKEMVKKVEPHGIKLSLEFCVLPACRLTASTTLMTLSKKLIARWLVLLWISIISTQWHQRGKTRASRR